MAPFLFNTCPNHWLKNAREYPVGTAVLKRKPHQEGIDSRDVSLTYFGLAVNIYYLILNNLVRIENDPKDLLMHNESVSLIALSYNCTESFLSCLISICCNYNQESDVEILRKSDVNAKIRLILKWYELDEVRFYKQETQLFQRFQEATTLRNSLFHERSGGKPIEIKYTSFPTSHYLVNMHDAFEMLRISVEFLKYFSKVIPDLNLVPRIPVERFKRGIQHFEFDRLYDNLLIPYATQCFKKHGIEIDNLKSYPTAPPQSKKIPVGSYDILLKAGYSRQYGQKSLERTQFYTEIAKKALPDEEFPGDGLIQIPRQ